MGDAVARSPAVALEGSEGLKGSCCVLEALLHGACKHRIDEARAPLEVRIHRLCDDGRLGLGKAADADGGEERLPPPSCTSVEQRRVRCCEPCVRVRLPHCGCPRCGRCGRAQPPPVHEVLHRERSRDKRALERGCVAVALAVVLHAVAVRVREGVCVRLRRAHEQLPHHDGLGREALAVLVHARAALEGARDSHGSHVEHRGCTSSERGTRCCCSRSPLLLSRDSTAPPPFNEGRCLGSGLAASARLDLLTQPDAPEKEPAHGCDEEQGLIGEGGACRECRRPRAAAPSRSGGRCGPPPPLSPPLRLCLEAAQNRRAHADPVVHDGVVQEKARGEVVDGVVLGRGGDDGKATTAPRRREQDRGGKALVQLLRLAVCGEEAHHVAAPRGGGVDVRVEVRPARKASEAHAHVCKKGEGVEGGGGVRIERGRGTYARGVGAAAPPSPPPS